MRFTTRLAGISVLAVAVVGCQTPGSTLAPAGPTVPGAGVANVKASDPSSDTPWLDGVWGATGPLGLHHSATTDSGFECTLGLFGPATNSHATLSNSGNETVTCSGSFPDAAGLPASAFVQKGQVACELHFTDEDGDGAGDSSIDSQVVIAPSGQVTLTCQHKK